MSIFLALYRLGLEWSDVAQMVLVMREGIDRANADLLDQWSAR